MTPEQEKQSFESLLSEIDRMVRSTQELVVYVRQTRQQIERDISLDGLCTEEREELNAFLKQQESINPDFFDTQTK